MIFDSPTGIRDGFGKALLDLGSSNPNVVALSADVTEPTRTHWFAERFPSRFYEMGISENDMIGTAAGMAINGLIPFATTFAVFATSLSHQAIRLSAAYNRANVKIVASHGGVTVGGDGATHQAFEDFALMRVIPDMTVLCPCDAHEAYNATLAIAEFDGPVYMRVGRIKSPVISDANEPFRIGAAKVLCQGSDVAVFANGIMVSTALEAASHLAERGIEVTVVSVATLKPLDRETVLEAVRACGVAVTVEEHSIIGGLGAAVAELLAAEFPAPLETVGIRDTFGESGEPHEILEKYGLTVADVVAAVHRGVKRKRTELGIRT